MAHYCKWKDVKTVTKQHVNHTLLRTGTLCLISLLETWALCLSLNLTTKNPAAFLFFAGLLFVHAKVPAVSKQKTPWIDLAGLLLALSFVFALHGSLTAQFTSRLFQLLVLVVLFAGMFLLSRTLLLGLQELVSRRASDIRRTETSEQGSNIKTTTHGKKKDRTLLLSFLLILVCYLPYFLYEFPGILSPDGAWQAEQAIGTRPLSNHHPVVHTLVIRLFYRLGNLFTSDPDTALSFYTFAQMAFHAFCGALCVKTLKDLGFRKRIWIPVLLFYAIVPFEAVYAVMVGKDTVFGDIALLLVLCLVRILQETEENGHRGKICGKSLVLFFLLSVCFCLFRTNGWYAFLLMTPFLLLILRRRVKQLLPVTVCVILAAGIIRGPVINAMNIEQPDTVESLCVPLQQVSAVVAEGKSLTKEESSLIDAVVPIESVKDQYNPVFADDMKELIRTTGDQSVLEKNRSAYVRLYITLGLRYPGTYLQAWINETEGFWFPDYVHDTANIDNVWTNNAGLVWRPILGGAFVKIKEILIKLGSFVPVYGLLWSSGFYAFLSLGAFALTLEKKESRKKDRRYVLLVLPSLCVLFTLLLATPIAAEFRYTLALTFTMPLTAFAPFLSQGEGIRQDTAELIHESKENKNV